MGSASPNKRKYPRVEGKGVAAYLRLNGHNAGCTVENISVGGVFVRTDRFLPVGTKLAFDLVKPGMKRALTVAGWIVGVITPELAARTRLPQGLRIQFAKMNPLATEALQELVGSLRRHTAEPPVLYPLENRGSGRRASGVRRGVKAAALPPAQLHQETVPRAKRGAIGGAPRSPSRALADEPASRTEVEMESPVARRWLQEGDADEATRGGDGAGVDDLLDAFPEEAAQKFQEDIQAAERAQARGEGGGDADGAEELHLTNQELQRLLDRREQEIAALRSQLTRAESQLREKDEQLQLARRVLKSNGLG